MTLTKPISHSPFQTIHKSHFSPIIAQQNKKPSPFISENKKFEFPILVSENTHKNLRTWGLLAFVFLTNAVGPYIARSIDKFLNPSHSLDDKFLDYSSNVVRKQFTSQPYRLLFSSIGAAIGIFICTKVFQPKNN